jgi:hypothetical protein
MEGRTVANFALDDMDVQRVADAVVGALVARLPEVIPNRQTDADGWVDRRALARIFGVSASTVDGWVRRGLPSIKAGARGRRFNLDEVRATLEKWGGAL